MHTKQTQLTALVDKVSTADVGRQHGFFNQLVRIIASTRHDLFDAAVVVADDLRLCCLKVHCAAHFACLEQRLEDAIQIQQILHAVFALGSFLTTGIGQNSRHLGIGKARMTVHDRRVELIGVNFALRRDQHVADHAQTIHIRIERAQPVAELFRQHRNHAAREIDAGRAVVGIDINGAARGHIVAHIRNRYEQTPTLAVTYLGRFAIHGIVKVARIFAVDCDQRNIGQVNTPGVIGG